MSRNPKRGGGATAALLTILILLMIAATAFVIWLCIDMTNRTPDTTSQQESVVQLPTSAVTQPPETEPPVTETEPEPEHVVATATIASMGDLLMHLPVINTCQQSDGSYDFSSIFQYVKDTVSSYDYAAVNLETTFGGSDYPIQGNPHFNCPDSLAQAALDAGYDMFLTANNHCGDTTADGILRTLEQSRGVGLKTLGTQMNDEEKKFEIVDVNGIKIGMIAYTYATSVTSDGRPSLNGNAALSQAGIVNYFMENNLEAFYTELEQRLAQMKQDGAEATIVYLHWGVEYLLEENSTQRAIAQKLCDLGVDVIIGGHPHVVEPIDLLESTVDPNHKSVILYSMGNAVSNQRQGNLSMISTAHTEDGVLFAVTFEKYSDGAVYLAGAEVVPTWVNMHSNNGSREYNILPLAIDKKEEWTSLFNLTQANYDAAVKSYDRTMEIVGEGLTECQTWLEQAKTDRENYYLELARNPGMNQQTQPTVTETIAEETTLPAVA